METFGVSWESVCPMVLFVCGTPAFCQSFSEWWGRNVDIAGSERNTLVFRLTLCPTAQGREGTGPRVALISCCQLCDGRGKAGSGPKRSEWAAGRKASGVGSGKTVMAQFKEHKPVGHIWGPVSCSCQKSSFLCCI